MLCEILFIEEHLKKELFPIDVTDNGFFKFKNKDLLIKKQYFLVLILFQK